MKDAACVGSTQRIRHRPPNRHRRLGVERSPASEDVADRASIEQLGDKERLPGRRSADVVDRDHVRMPRQRSDDSCLALEPPPGPRIIDLLADQLDGHFSAEAVLPRPIYDRTSTPTERRKHGVARQGRPATDCGAALLGRDNGSTAGGTEPGMSRNHRPAELTRLGPDLRPLVLHDHTTTLRLAHLPAGLAEEGSTRRDDAPRTARARSCGCGTECWVRVLTMHIQRRSRTSCVADCRLLNRCSRRRGRHAATRTQAQPCPPEGLTEASLCHL